MPAAQRDTAQMRLVGAVIAGAMLAWLGIGWLGGHYDWAAKWAYLADLAAIGAFVWSLLVTWRIWRRRDGQGPRG